MKMKCQRGMVTREKERDSGYLDNMLYPWTETN